MRDLTAKQQQDLEAFGKMIEGMINNQKLVNAKNDNSGGSANTGAFDAKQQADLDALDDIISKNIDTAKNKAQEPIVSDFEAQAMAKYQKQIDKDAAMADFQAQAMANYQKQNDINAEQQRQRKIQAELKRLKFMTTKQLSEAKLEEETIEAYINKFLLKNCTLCNFDYTDRNTRSSSGLQIMACMYSNTHFISNVYDGDVCSNLINIVRNTLQSNVVGNSNKRNSSVIALELLKAYDDGELQYDALPSEELIQQYLDNYNQANNVNLDDFNNSFMDNNQSGYGQDINDSQYDLDDYGQKKASQYYNDLDNPSIYSEDNFPEYPGYSYDKDGNININPRQSHNVMVLNTNSYGVVTNPNYHTIEKFKKVLFESRNGTAYEFKKRWDFVLSEIKRLFPNAAMVTRIAIMGTQITVNGKLLLIDSILGGDYDIRVEDIVSVRATFKKFPYIQYLVLDNVATQNLITEYGQDATGIWKVFQENKPLKTLGLMKSCSGEPVNYNREDFQQNPTEIANALNNQLQEEKFRMQMEQAFAYRNPRLHEKSPGYINKVWKTGSAFGGKSWERAKKNFMDDKSPKLMRFMGWSAIAVLCFGIGGVLGIPGAIKHAITKK